MHAAILAGGRGKRFWPFSRAGRPKQFLDITGGGSMLALTYRRLSEFIPPERIMLLTVEEQLPLVRADLPELPGENIFVEPVGRNTGPSLAAAAALALSAGNDDPMLCCPSDHLIARHADFRELAAAAADVAARSDVLVTFGIEPDRPATGYGYIEAGGAAEESRGLTFHNVVRFHEKPDEARAREYIKSGDFFWNSGIFCWRPSVFIAAWERCVPEAIEPLRKLAGAFDRGEGGRTVRDAYASMPAVSVDYGVLEKADNVLVAPADLGWNDVGSWDALFDILEGDGEGNVTIGDVELLDSSGNLFFSPDGVVAGIGVRDLIVVVSEGKVLVCPRGQSQRVKELLEKLEREEKTELL